MHVFIRVFCCKPKISLTIIRQLLEISSSYVNYAKEFFNTFFTCILYVRHVNSLLCFPVLPLLYLLFFLFLDTFYLGDLSSPLLITHMKTNTKGFFVFLIGLVMTVWVSYQHFMNFSIYLCHCYVYVIYKNYISLSQSTS